MTSHTLSLFTSLPQVDFTSLSLSYAMAFVVGSLVYGPVLGKPWAKAMQQEKRDEKWAEASIQRKGMLSLFIVNAFLQFLQTAVLAYFLAACRVETAAEGSIVGFWVWFGLFMPYTVSHANWEDRPITVVLITLFNDLTILLLNGAMLATRHSYKSMA